MGVLLVLVVLVVVTGVKQSQLQVLRLKKFDNSKQNEGFKKWSLGVKSS